VLLGFAVSMIASLGCSAAPEVDDSTGTVQEKLIVGNWSVDLNSPDKGPNPYDFGTLAKYSCEVFSPSDHWWHPGKLFSDQCRLEWGGGVVVSNTYRTLQAPPPGQAYTWSYYSSGSGTPTNAVVSSSGNLPVCSVEGLVQGIGLLEPTLGKLWQGRCYFEWGGSAFGAGPNDPVASVYVLTYVPRVAIKTYNGNYITAESDGGGVVSTNRTAVGAWEVFGIYDYAYPIMSGDIINLSHAGSSALWFGTADVNGGGSGSLFRINRTTPGPWENFTINKVGGGNGVIQSGDQVRFVSQSGWYMSAINGGGLIGDGSVTVDRAQASTWETFTLMFQ
jgi:hypothetical protein